MVSACNVAAPKVEPRELEVRLLADLLRLSRVTVLYGKAGSGKTTLLKAGLLPVLARRAEDRDLLRGRHDKVVLPFAERRRVSTARAETAIFFDEWNDAPLEGLQACTLAAVRAFDKNATLPNASLADCLSRWNKEFDLRFFFILDRFEDYLAAPVDAPAIRDFADELERIIVGRLPANVLISVSEDATALLERFRVRIPGFGDDSFHLRAFEPADAASEKPADTAAREEPVEAAANVDAEAALGSQPPRQPIGVDDRKLQTSIARSLWARGPGVSADGVNEQGRLTSGDRRSDFAVPAPSPTAADTAAATAKTIGGPRLRKWLAVGATCAGIALGIAGIERPFDRNTSQLAEPKTEVRPLGENMSAPVASPAQSSLPKVGLRIEPHNSTAMLIAEDAARVIAPDGGIELVVRSSAPNWQNDSIPQLAIMHYEALQAARSSAAGKNDRSSRIRVIAPLYTEELYVLARRDSKLQYIHEIQGMRINAGPADSDRELIATRLYQNMLRTPLPATNLTFFDDREALNKLVFEKTIDVVIVVAGQPVKWLADLPRRLAGAVKLLKRGEATHPVTGTAIELYLPVVIRAANFNWLAEDIPTFATMSFLVTSDYEYPVFAEHIESFMRTLCRKLPELRRIGHPKWREVAAGLEVDTGWPYAARARAAYQSCVP